MTSLPPQYSYHLPPPNLAPPPVRGYRPAPPPPQPERYVPIRERAWFGTLAAGIALCGIVGTISDLLEPVGPYVNYAIAGAVTSLFLFVLLYSLIKNLRFDLGPVIVANIIALVALGGLKIAQVYGGDDGRGVLASHVPQLAGLQKSVLGIEERVIAIGEGLGRVEQGVGRIEDTTRRVDERTVEIGANVEETKRSVLASERAQQEDRDPSVQAQRARDVAKEQASRDQDDARQLLTSKGLTLDGAGYISAIARGDQPAQEAFDKLGIGGDEQSLRVELAKHSIDSPEFKNLTLLFAQINSSGHFAKPVADELRSALNSVRKAGTANGLLSTTCEQPDEKLFARIMRSHLSATCANEAEWLQAARRYLNLLWTQLQSTNPTQDIAEVGWFTYLNAPSPVTTKFPLKRKLAKSKPISLAQFRQLRQSFDPNDSSIYELNARVFFNLGMVVILLKDGSDLNSNDYHFATYDQQSNAPCTSIENVCAARLVMTRDPRNTWTVESAKDIKLIGSPF